MHSVTNSECEALVHVTKCEGVHICSVGMVVDDLFSNRRIFWWSPNTFAHPPQLEIISQAHSESIVSLQSQQHLILPFSPWNYSLKGNFKSRPRGIIHSNETAEEMGERCFPMSTPQFLEPISVGNIILKLTFFQRPRGF